MEYLKIKKEVAQEETYGRFKEEVIVKKSDVYFKKLFDTIYGETDFLVFNKYTDELLGKLENEIAIEIIENNIF